MDIIYSTQRVIPPEALQMLLKQTEWAESRQVVDLQVLLDNSFNIGAWSGDELVGYARVLTDMRFRAFIEDVVVAENQRGTGIGRGLVETIMRELAHIEEIVLCCSTENIPFYEKFGFKVSSNNYMHIWNG